MHFLAGEKVTYYPPFCHCKHKLYQVNAKLCIRSCLIFNNKNIYRLERRMDTVYLSFLLSFPNPAPPSITQAHREIYALYSSARLTSSIL